MSSIKFNQTTREIEISGPESFIEANFPMIRKLAVESSGAKMKKTSKTVNVIEQPESPVKHSESQTADLIRVPDSVKASDILSAIKPEIPDTSQEPKAPRPPVRKYFNTLGKLIRCEDTSINKSLPVSDIVKPVANRFSIASLKEHFGLSEHQIEGIIRDAEKEGRVRKNPDGSYEWL